jgi:valine--pyruvate aminotransferase
MSLKLSKFGERFTRKTGALELMDDLGSAMSGERTQLMLGGGNPGRIPAVEAYFRGRLAEVAGDEREFGRMLANYAHPRGEITFRRSLASLLKREYGWPLTEDNIALTAGSQAAFFMLFNLFAGETAAGSAQRILLPLTPEYVGYADVGLAENLFTARRPVIEDLPDGFFKYRLDVANLSLEESIGAVCVSRPTNPTGNVLTDAEMRSLDALCRAGGVPLIVDSAYGAPFPSILFTDGEPIWNPNIVHCMSLSKLGLPGARTGIVIASEDIVAALTNMTAVMNLAVGSVGPVLAQPLVESGAIMDLSRLEIAPYYRKKALAASALLQRGLAGLPLRIHKPEGAFFLWLWFPNLPIASAELYRRLKAAGVLVLSGHYFFPGLGEDSWPHRQQCVRVSFAQDDRTVERGIDTIVAEVRELYRAN